LEAAAGAEAEKANQEAATAAAATQAKGATTATHAKATNQARKAKAALKAPAFGGSTGGTNTMKQV